MALKRCSIEDGEGILRALDEDGAVIVKQFVPVRVVEELNEELSGHVERRGGGFRGIGEEFYGKNTVRIQGLARKSKTFVEEILQHPTLLMAAEKRLCEHSGSFWMSQAETIFIGPGEKAQPLHRDDLNWTVASRLGVDLQLSALVALGDYDEEVGATVVVPGSHRGDGSECVVAEMERGDGMLYTGRVLHGGGSNKTHDRWRRALYIGLIVSWLTPEEAVSCSLSAEDVEKMSLQARALLGWGAQRGNPDGTGVSHAEALQLWQMDEDDVERSHRRFVQ